MEEVECPICQNTSGGTCQRSPLSATDSFTFNCEICGIYEISDMACVSWFDPNGRRLTDVQCAALSHRLRTAARGSQPLIITTDWLQRFEADATLPSPSVQATNIIRYIGDEVSRSGQRLEALPVEFHAVVGSPNRELACGLVSELIERGILSGIDVSDMGGTDFIEVNLTLDGWDRYEEEKAGLISGKYGFIAMKFDDPVLDPFVEKVVKPAIDDGIGYSVVDMRNVARAGIIDNIMRAQIRDAAFVIVDLTHDNSGAYWEAGYAEGLGKPVIYICEKNKFDEAKTHFDTNHCTTVLWSEENEQEFRKEIVATLRRSLDLFPAKP